ncbi:MAG: hypothetical protein JSU90_07430 [Nitrospiraceae bacterium]|nr:MAG: hypothetical protein JSU90_07430 [Nitrospiraceae bacterium]
MKIDWGKISIKDLASLVCGKLNEKEIDAVLVGGACVSIYTNNTYVSYDLDFVSHTSLKHIAGALSGLGFRRESTRHFVRKDCPFFIEFVAPPLSIGTEPVKQRKKLKSRFGELVLLTPTDSVKDRLAAFYHWNDTEALEQAVLVAKAQKVSLEEVRRWSEHEGHMKKYEIFIATLKK